MEAVKEFFKRWNDRFIKLFCAKEVGINPPINFKQDFEDAKQEVERDKAKLDEMFLSETFQELMNPYSNIGSSGKDIDSNKRLATNVDCIETIAIAICCKMTWIQNNKR